MSTESCLFCRIVRGEIEAAILHRDENVVAFRDVRPVAPTHVLIVPTRHVESVNDLGPAGSVILDQLAIVAREIATREGVSSSGYRLVINTGADAGQSVFHLHMHLLGGRKMSWPPG